MCSECGADVSRRDDKLGFLPLRGPGKITSMNVDRFFDDAGKRFLVIEEKHDGEHMPDGQRYALKALANQEAFTVLLAEGTPEWLTVSVMHKSGSLTRLVMGPYAIYEQVVLDWFRKEGWFNELASG